MPDAPQTAQQAAEQLAQLSDELNDRRRTAARMRQARDDAERTYKQQSHRRMVAVEGRNAQVRKAKVMDDELAGEVRADAAEIADRLGISGWTPETVDDLRWLRDRADGIAEACSAAAYGTRGVLQAHTTVWSWAKAEFEHAMSAPHEGVGT